MGFMYKHLFDALLRIPPKERFSILRRTPPFVQSRSLDLFLSQFWSVRSGSLHSRTAQHFACINNPPKGNQKEFVQATAA